MNNTGFVYKLVCKDINVQECYVGSTGNTRIRKCRHKSDCNNVNGKNFNFRVYQYIRENDGFQNWELVVLETVQYNKKYELKARERHNLELLRATLNTQTPGRTKAEWNQDNTEHTKEHKKQWYVNNSDQIKEQQKQYRVDNAEQINQQKKQYRVDNTKQIKQKQKQKHNCECGGKYTQQHKTRQEKSIKHQKHLEQ